MRLARIGVVGLPNPDERVKRLSRSLGESSACFALRSAYVSTKVSHMELHWDANIPELRPSQEAQLLPGNSISRNQIGFVWGDGRPNVQNVVKRALEGTTEAVSVPRTMCSNQYIISENSGHRAHGCNHVYPWFEQEGDHEH